MVGGRDAVPFGFNGICNHHFSQQHHCHVFYSSCFMSNEHTWPSITQQRSDWQGTLTRWRYSWMPFMFAKQWYTLLEMPIWQTEWFQEWWSAAGFTEHLVHLGQSEMVGIFLSLIHFKSATCGSSLTNTCGPLPLRSDRRWLPGPAECGMPSWVLEFPKYRTCRRAGPISLHVRAVASWEVKGVEHCGHFPKRTSLSENNGDSC